MSQTKYESDVREINYSQDAVYQVLSDMKTAGLLKRACENPSVIQAMGSQLKPEQIEKARGLVEKMTFDDDSVTVPTSQLGAVTLRVIDREPSKYIKFESQGLPLQANLWIQILPTSAASCKMKVTVGAELNFFIKKMVGGKLQTGVNQMAELLARLPYAALQSQQ